MAGADMWISKKNLQKREDEVYNRAFRAGYLFGCEQSELVGPEIANKLDPGISLIVKNQINNMVSIV